MKKNGSDKSLDDALSVKDEKEFEEKAALVTEQLPQKLAKINSRLRLVADILALFRFMTDPDVHWAKKALAVGALLYFIIPVDSIPDVAPFVGYLDDLGVITLVVAYLGKQLKSYYAEEA